MGGGVWLATLLGFCGRWGWIPDLAAHFRIQYLGVAVGGAFLLLLARRQRASLLLAACAAVNVLVAWRHLVPALPAPRPPAQASLLAVNVHTGNRRFAELEALVRELRPDFLLLLEVDEGWVEGTVGLRRDYPHGIVEARPDNFGIALLSRRPCRECRVVRPGEAGLPTVVGRFPVGGRWLTLAGTHPLPPVGAENARAHRDQLHALAELVARVPGPRVLAGDLNTTPWSARFRPLLRGAGLRDSGVGQGPGGSWPAGTPFLSIPIDHFLHSPEVVVVTRRWERPIGSDHLPLYVGFALR